VINLTRFRDRTTEEIIYPRNWMQTLWYLARLQYDIVHLHIGGGLTPRLLGLSLVCCLMPRSRAVLTFHSGGYPESEAGRSARAFSMRGVIFRRFDRIIAVNPDIERLFRRFGVSEDRIALIYPHVDVSPPPDMKLPEPFEQFFERHGPVLVTAGLLEPEYDLTLQIDLLESVRAKHPGAGLVIIGSGSLEGALREYISAKPYAEHVVLCGDVPHPVVLRTIADSDLFLRTTLYDGDSVAVREALYLGTPVIATDTGMRPDGVTLIPKSDPRALSAAVDVLLGSEPPAVSGGGAGEDNIRAVVDLYREIAPG
jgi:glycosyltransferase involved in cell wall biosynthesis